MSVRRALVLWCSTMTVLVLAVVLVAARQGEPRADLVGSPVTTTPTTEAPPTPVPAPPPATSVPAPESVRPPGTPRRLRLPDLSVDAEVVPVGLEPDGSMEVPPADRVGWYVHGVRPGADRGSAVLAAHVDQGGERGVFFELARLPVGATVEVVDDAGDTRRWTVTERYQVDKDTLDIPELFRDSGPPALTLITCGGAFDRGARSYEDNLVVRGVLS